MKKMVRNAKEVNLKDFGDLEEEIREEMVCVIDDYVNGETSSFTRDLQPPKSVIKAMATAAAQVLISFERGFRLGG